MSNEKKIEELDEKQISDAPVEDWFLQTLVELSSKKVGFGITLNVGGALVTGKIISAPDYFEATGQLLAEDIDDSEVAETFSNMFMPFAEDSRKSLLKYDPAFIHLKDAKFFSGSTNPIPGSGGFLWRGRISQIIGFHLGVLEIN